MGQFRYLPLVSSLHDADVISAVTEPYLARLSSETGLKPVAVSPDNPELPSVIYIQSGGTESAFRRLFPRLPSPVILLSHPAQNSLPASLEILAWLNSRGCRAVIVHGSPEEAAGPLRSYIRALETARLIRCARLGLCGPPSDWLISSLPDPASVEKRWGCRVIEISLEELVLPSGFATGPAGSTPSAGAVEQARGLFPALLELIQRYRLDGITLRCFDLLSRWGNTGCLALAELNDAGIPAACEGDLPALFTMLAARSLTGISGFMANPSSWSPSRRELILAHCSVPFSLLEDYDLDTHFESGIGVGIRGKFRLGPGGLIKIGGKDLSQLFFCRGEIKANLSRDDLCRTQIVFEPAGDFSSYLSRPLGNHLIFVPGRWEETAEAFRHLFF